MSPKIIQDKKADISITILVLGVFAICAVAIISFIIVGSSSSNTFSGPETIENLSSNLENFYFYINAGYSPQDAANMIGAQLNGNQLILSGKQFLPPTVNALFIKNPKPVLSVQYFIDINK